MLADFNLHDREKTIDLRGTMNGAALPEEQVEVF